MADDWSAAADPDAIGAVLDHTAFGHAWAARLVLAAALVAAVAFLPRDRWAPIALVSAASLASLALVGHAAMQTGIEGIAHRANHAAHLLAAGAWLGGLIPFMMCVSAYGDNELRPDAVRAMAGFSFWGQFVVAAIVLTGAVNIALISGRAPFPPTTPYRALLDAKIVIVGLMISLAVFNRFYLAPKLSPGAAALAALRVTSVIEAALEPSSSPWSASSPCSIRREEAGRGNYAGRFRRRLHISINVVRSRVLGMNSYGGSGTTRRPTRVALPKRRSPEIGKYAGVTVICLRLTLTVAPAGCLSTAGPERIKPMNATSGRGWINWPGAFWAEATGWPRQHFSVRQYGSHPDCRAAIAACRRSNLRSRRQHRQLIGVVTGS